SSSSSSSSSTSSSSSNSSAHSQQQAVVTNVTGSSTIDGGEGPESGLLQDADGVSSSVEDVAGVKDDARDGGMMTEEVAVVFSDHSEEQGSEINVHSGTGSGAGGGGFDCSESSSSGSSIVTGVSAGSVDNSSSSSESTAVTGGLSEETAGSNQLPATAEDDISSINSSEKPIGGSNSVHESLDDEADLSLEEMALSTV
uniref:Uncharacterized protein n=1 Tax=Anopheles maculatus TaxID=74869 RepID=A0A182SCA8_9DIPT